MFLRKKRFFFSTLFFLVGFILFSQQNSTSSEVSESSLNQTEENNVEISGNKNEPEPFDDVFADFFASSQSDTLDEVFNSSETDSLDDLFSTPVADNVTTQQPAVDYKTRVEQNNDKILFKGNFTASGGISFGWKSFPNSAESFKKDFGVSPVALANVHLYLDARPIPEIKIFADLYTEINPNAIGNGWIDARIESLYGEYDFKGFTYFRVGQFSTKWGNGRIFTPGNLMLNSERGTSLSLTFPTLLDGIKYAVTADYDGLPQAIKDAKSKKDVAAKELVHALVLDKAFGRTRLTLGARYQIYDGIKGLVSANTILFGTDIFTDIVLLNPDFTSYDNFKFKVLAGFYREWKQIKLYFEYFYDGASNYKNDHNLGLGLQFEKIFNSLFNFNLLAEHTFSDNSGNVIPMFTISPWKNITINFGMPIIWGRNGSRYLLEKDKEQYSRTDITNDIPRDKQLSFLIAVKFSAPF